MEIHQLFGARLGGEMVKGNVCALGDHQHMNWRLGVDVVKGQRVGGFQHGFVGNFAAQDTGEDVLRVVGVHSALRNQGSDQGFLAKQGLKISFRPRTIVRDHLSRRNTTHAAAGGQGLAGGNAI